MGDEMETELKCPRCGGEMGEGSVDKGWFSSTCLSCGYEMQGPFCPAVEPQPVWNVRIRWSGETPTLKEAALMRKFLPGFGGMSIQYVRALFEHTPEWKARGVSKQTMLELRTAAESLGFKVEVEEEGKRWREAQRPPPGSPVSLYGVRFEPSFHEEGFILVTFGQARDFISIARDKGYL